MEVIAQAKFVRQTPRKLRLTADEIRGLSALEAETVLKSLNKKSARLLLKTLRQGMANAENNFKLNKEDLKIKRLEIGEGPRMKRYRFVAKGRVHKILKRMAHIKMVLEGEEKKEAKKVTKKKEGKKKPASAKTKAGKKDGTKS